MTYATWGRFQTTLPLNTNQWNALRFVALTLVCVPIIEKALHKLHQLNTARRISNSEPARIRRSRLGNFGLHQEVDELSYCSKITLILVVVFYVGLSLVTEFASGSAQVETKGTWVAPVSQGLDIRGKLRLYDTNLMSAGRYKGCMSRSSRIAMHQLSEDIVYRELLPYRPPRMRKVHLKDMRGISWIKLTTLKITVPIHDNGTHIRIEDPSPTGFPIHAVMDNKKVCFQRRLPLDTYCFPKDENITLLGMAGNLLHFTDGLVQLPTQMGSKQLLSNEAFEVQGADEQDIEERASLANARTRDEFWESRRKTGLLGFRMKFRYAEIAIGDICNKQPRLQSRTPKILHNESFASEYMKPKVLVRLNTTATCIGLFPNQLEVFLEISNSSMVCYRTPANFPFEPDMLCAILNSKNTISLSKMRQILTKDQAKNEFYAEWSLTWPEQDLDLADLARGAFVYFMLSRNLYGFHAESFIPAEPTQIRAEARRMAVLFKQGVQKLNEVGKRDVVYDLSWREERATLVIWVFLIWVIAFVIGLCFLVLVKLKRSSLVPDLNFLYRQAVMQQYTEYNVGEAIQETPTVTMLKREGIARLKFSYSGMGSDELPEEMSNSACCL